jgi:hypothetical protein
MRIEQIHVNNSIGTRKKILGIYAYNENGERQHVFPGFREVTYTHATSTNTAFARPKKQFKTTGMATSTNTAFARTLTQLLGVNYPNSVNSTGSGFAVSGPTSNTQVGAPTIVGGSGSYNYLWEYVSGDTTIGITSTSVQRPSFGCPSVNQNNPRSAVWRVTVTDTVSGEVAQDTVTINCTWTNLS